MTYESHRNHISCVLGRHLQAGCFTPAYGRFYTCIRAVLHLQAGGFTPAGGRFYTCKQGPYSVWLPKDCHFGRSVGVVRDLKG